MTSFRKYPRVQWFDYNEGIFFVTIVTHNRLHYFGEITDNIMSLNRCGMIAQNEIDLLPKRLNNIELHNAVVMPNHIHLLLGIENTEGTKTGSSIINMGGLHCPEHPNNKDLPFEMRNHFASLLSTTVCGLKSGITREIRKTGYDFRWQPRYHEHIVKHKQDYELINKYIAENPLLWDKDVINDCTK